jgi:hypothetical protein
VSLHGIVEDNVPRVELKARLASESLVGTSHSWSGKASDCLFGNASGNGVAKVDLTLALASTESSIQ